MTVVARGGDGNAEAGTRAAVALDNPMRVARDAPASHVLHSTPPSSLFGAWPQPPSTVLPPQPPPPLQSSVRSSMTEESQQAGTGLMLARPVHGSIARPEQRVQERSAAAALNTTDPRGDVFVGVRNARGGARADSNGGHEAANDDDADVGDPTSEPIDDPSP